MGDDSKRARSQSEPSVPSTVPGSPIAVDRNPELERRMGELGLDEEFKTSIRAMTPTTQQEIMNDIIRNRQMEESARLIPDSGEEDEEEPMVRVIFGNPLNEEGGEEMPEHPLQTILPLLFMSGRGGSDPLLRQRLMNIFQQLGQLSAMQNMGIDRDIDDMSYEELLELEERIGSVSKGLPEAKIPEYLKKATPPKEGTCSVCLTEWGAEPEHDEACCALSPCQHVFHEECIKQWLRSNKQCPLCKQEVVRVSGQ